jgi:hypothetical protein
MFDPKKIRRGAEIAPRKVVIYGPPKMGKSTLAAAAKNALLVPTEDRVKHINCAKTEVVSSFDEILQIMEYLGDGNSGFDSVIFDTLDWMEPMIHQYVCAKKKFKSLIDDNNKETNFGRGLKFHAVEGWKIFLTNCDILREEAGLNIILLAHSAVEKVSPPDADGYDRYTMKLDKNAVAVVEEWADIIGFYNREVIVKKEDAGFGKKTGKALNVDTNRVLNTQASAPSWISGNSFGLPDFNVDPESMTDIMDIILGHVSWPDMVPVKQNPKKK